MSRINNLIKDKECHNVKHNVFLCDYIQYNKDALTDDEKYKAISIKEIMTIWGYEHFYDEMIDNFVFKIKNHSNRNICVYYDHGDLTKNKDKQKLLGWDIFDETEDRYILVGGVLFVNGEMSFHT